MVTTDDKTQSKTDRILAGLERKNICLPPGFRFDWPHALDCLLGAIESSLSASERKDKPPEGLLSNDDDDDDEKAPGYDKAAEAPMSFDERPILRCVCGGKDFTDCSCKSIKPVPHLAPAAAERAAQAGLGRTGNNFKPRS